jgi:hypothetical protein
MHECTERIDIHQKCEEIWLCKDETAPETVTAMAAIRVENGNDTNRCAI